MIHFEKAIQLAAIFSKAFCDNSGTLSAQSCVLMEQVEHNKTRLTTMEPGKAIFRYWFVHTTADSGGQPGTVYLIDQSELKSQLALIKDAGVGSLTIRLNRGQLSMVADSVMTNRGAKERGRRNIRQYSGPTDDFKPLFDPAQLVADSIEANLFRHWVSSLQNFGQFTTAQTGDVVRRSVMVQIGEVLEGITNHPSCYMAYIRAAVATNKHLDNSRQFSIEGRHLSKLASVSVTDPVSIYIDQFEDEEWVTFAGDSGAVSLKMLEPEQRFLMDYRLFEDDPRFLLESVRGVDLKEFSSAVTLQIPTDPTQQRLLLLEERPNIRILQAQNIKGDECSYTQLNPEYLEGTWQPAIFNSLGLKTILKMLKTFLSSIQTETDSFILLSQKSVKRQSGSKSWLCLFSPVIQQENIQVAAFMQVIPVDEAIDEVEINE
jgi:hypothetical protein